MVNPLTYPKSSTPFDDAVFRDPAAEYRGAPLWSWNGKLEPGRLQRQIDALAEMGMGGFHMHARVGLDTPYMSDEFLDCVEVCAKKAREKKMLACLYDDDRWPSGCAGGLVTKDNDDFGTKHILLTPWPYGHGQEAPHRIGYGPKGKGARSENGVLVARYDIQVGPAGVVDYRRLSEGDVSGDCTWYAYIERNPPGEWYNGCTYVDCMNVEATQHFLESTHEKYYTRLKQDFGAQTPTIFTDEPQVEHKALLPFSSKKTDCLLPWGKGFGESFEELYNYDILDRLPEFLWDTTAPSQTLTRYHYNDHVTERFIAGFHDTVAAWCREKDILLTGHMMMEPTLLSQCTALGEAMRCYRKMGLPGIDLLCDKIEFNTAKQASSVGRQNGIRGVTSEIYGVTNWTFTFDGHKGCGDWQAALGITFRVHHLSAYTLLGEAKRDYPAAISYQSPWYRQYHLVEDYFSRVNVALTRGKPVTRVAVIHPIESYWLCFGPQDRNGEEQRFRDQAFSDLSNWLLHGLIDFDFISESLFVEQTNVADITEVLPVGACRYEAIIVPNLKTIRSSTLERLRAFAAAGGRVIMTGETPTLVDASPADASIPDSEAVHFTPFHILRAVEQHRDVAIFSHGKVADKMLYQLRKDGVDKFLFICNMDRQHSLSTSVRLRGTYQVTVLDAVSGKQWLAASHAEAGWTVLPWVFEATASILLRLSPLPASNGVAQQVGQAQVVHRDTFKRQCALSLRHITLSEDNVLLLDKASFLMDGTKEAWSEVTEVLRIDNLARQALGRPPKGEGIRQPWAFEEVDRQPIGTLRLRFVIHCQEPISGPVQLAMEGLGDASINLDGESVASAITGWWVDEDIHTATLLPEGKSLLAGDHILEIASPFAILSSIERVYLLGDFGVEIAGEHCSLHRLDLSRLSFGDWTTKGLPFYAGNVSYHCSAASPGGNAALQLPELVGSPVATVSVDGGEDITVGFQPYVADLGELPAGAHNIVVTAFGNRENAFGAIHVPNGKTKWFGPDAWRTEHDWWTDGYNVKPMGVFQSPQLLVPGKEIYSQTRPTGI